MSNKLVWKSLLVSPAIVGAALALAGTANAAENLVNTEVNQTASTEIAQAQNSELLNQLNDYSEEGQGNQADQVNSVFQLRDVSPGDWAFEALRNLVEKYGCIAGYPDRTFRGNRAMTRYEFAAGLNACLQSIERLISGAPGGNYVTQEELQQVKRLVQEFEAELATLGARVDNLEGRVAFLEDHQFSTTTKLQGEAIFALTDTFGDNSDTQTVFGDRVRLALNSSFTGKDRLVTRLAAGNLGGFDVSNGTVADVDGVDPQSFQTFNLAPGGNDIQLDWLAYYFPLGKANVYVAATGGIHSDYVANTLNPYFEDYDGGNGALSTFASESPIYRIGGGAGVGVKIPFGSANVSLGYLAGPTASDPSSGNGLFNGDYAALGQLDFNLGDRVGIGLTYVHGYHTGGQDLFDLGGGSGVVGTSAANNPIAGGYNTNSYGLELAFKLSEKISISGFGSLTDVEDDDDQIWTYGGGIAFADLGKEGNVLGIFAGAPPYVDSQDTPIHVEAFYKYKLTDNISITPGVIWLSNPNGDENNDDAFIGTLRTTFTF